MSFTKKYLAWLLVPPLVVSVGPSLLFLAQTIQLSPAKLVVLFVLLAVMYGGGCLAFAIGLRPYLRRVEAALQGRDELSGAMSDCLDRTRVLSLILWGGGGVLFALIAWAALMRNVLGFASFLVAALMAGFISVVWGYATGKHLLVAAAAGKPIRYTGGGIPLGRKIAIVFIGSLTLSSAALILLVSSRVSSTLEGLAIDSAEDRFARLLETANLQARVDGDALDTMKYSIPAGYALHLIDRNGNVVANTDKNKPLEPDAARAISQYGTGDSRSFVHDRVAKFARLKDNSILVLTIPFDAYRGIPNQVMTYTLIVMLLTTAAFIVATIVLSRDVTHPLHELRGVAQEMAGGNFEVAPRVFADDEVGQLAGSFGETRFNLRRLLGRVGGSGTTITDGVRVITGGTEMLLARSREQSELTQRSTSSLENVRGGIREVLQAADTVNDLTHDASARSLELQASAEEVARSMDYLFQSVEKTSSSATQMNATMGETSQRTEVLASIGEEVLSFVAEMDSTVSELLTSSQSTAELAEQVREDARGGGDAVQRTVEGINATHELTVSTARTMDELQRSVGEISRILSVIEEVANQTNLLSLNAAIIAAQAGEHGAGFTVVSDEIRQLAERTRGSTKEIAAIIKAVQSGSRAAVAKMHEGVARVTQNVKLAEEAASSLTKIVASATRSYEMATRISRSLGEQSSASRRLHEVTSRMSDHIAEINRATSEQARGTQLMAQESERVRDIAAQVKNATEEQSQAGRGITAALERMADDARAMRDLLERQLEETDRIADASRVMLDIARQNDDVAREFDSTMQNLVRSGREFETEVGRFRFTGGE
ncbi:MAG TPA: HAMP domain-containing methyl-accepting chemotaxis protein [Thermoanaerobaculia bacterium]|nr:HAMP domain-containing methyl-accepting chemotaxis protein [Thermoanaerobaculia bacterium]